MKNDDDIKVDLKQYKGHHRKFPWALFFRIIVAAFIIVGVIVLVKYLPQVQQESNSEKDTEIEIQFEP